MAIDEELTRIVIGCFYTVYNKLDWGFLENVYVGALEHELRKRGLIVHRQVPLAVWYDGIIVGTYRADLLVERRLVLEIKACAPSHEHSRQLLNYLRCSEQELGLLLYFDKSPRVKRVILRNALKRHLVAETDERAVQRENGGETTETTIDHNQGLDQS